MAGKFVTRALMIAGLVMASAAATYAQAPVAARVHRVAPSAEKLQPVAASSVILNTDGTVAKSAASLNLTAAQRSQIVSLNNEVASLQSERARLWSEYKAIVHAPNFSDEIAAAEAHPRMVRILEINSQLAGIVARQDKQMASILSPSQQSVVARMVASAKAAQ
jgi:hypothetical protein